MTVEQLIRRLEEFPADMEVVISMYNQGFGGLFSINSTEAVEVKPKDCGDASGTVLELGR